LNNNGDGSPRRRKCPQRTMRARTLTRIIRRIHELRFDALLPGLAVLAISTSLAAQPSLGAMSIRSALNAQCVHALECAPPNAALECA